MVERSKIRSIVSLVLFGAACVMLGQAIEPFIRSYAYDFDVIEDSARKYPELFRAQLNTSKRYIDKKQWAFALAYAERAMSLQDINSTGTEHKPYINAGTSAFMLGAYKLSLKYFTMAYQYNPDKRIQHNIDFLESIVANLPELQEVETDTDEFEYP